MPITAIIGMTFGPAKGAGSNSGQTQSQQKQRLMHDPIPLSFTAHPHGFHARGPGHQACFLEAQWDRRAKAITWTWRIHSTDMAALLADGHAATPEAAEATMRDWLAAPRNL